MSRCSIIALLLAVLPAAAVGAASERGFTVSSAECLGFVLDAQSGLRAGDQIRVDGTAVLVEGKDGHMTLDRAQLLRACRVDSAAVEVVVLRTQRIAVR
jgi:hypothetical protein